MYAVKKNGPDLALNLQQVVVDLVDEDFVIGLVLDHLRSQLIRALLELNLFLLVPVDDVLQVIEPNDEALRLFQVHTCKSETKRPLQRHLRGMDCSLAVVDGVTTAYSHGAEWGQITTLAFYSCGQHN